jgi:tripartite-type tricarboxylate transporter receptor subunit TctC
VVENRPGAGGTIAAGEIARAPADGHHFFVGFNGPLATAHLLYPKLPYHPLRDLKPVIATVSQPHVLVVPAQGNAASKSLSEFVALMKAQPGRFQYASVGNASASHLAMELFKAEAGFFMVHIPYQGGPAAVLATMQDQVQALFTAYVNVQAPIQQGRLRLLALAQHQASPGLGPAPRFADLGYPRVNAPLFNAVAAPAATADSIIEPMNLLINTILAEASIKEALAKSGMDQLLLQEEARWAPIVKALRVELG